MATLRSITSPSTSPHDIAYAEHFAYLYYSECSHEKHYLREFRVTPPRADAKERRLRRRELQFSQGVSLASSQGGGPLSSLTKSELAELYFPGAPRSSALRLLHKYITSAHGLLPALEEVGYQRASRRLTRRQVMLIFEYLGEP